MKKMSKVICLLLSLFVVFSLANFAFADESETSQSIIDADELKKMFDEYVAQYNLNGGSRSFSVGFCYLRTGDTWYYNDGKWYYSASLYKVPVSMLLAEKEMAGEITADTVFENQYSTGSLDTLEMKSLVNSNNDTGHALVEWMGGTYNGKCADQLKKFAPFDDSFYISDFYDYSYYNVSFYTEVLKTLYNNQANYPRIIDYMKQAQPGAYLRTYLDGTYEVAQKYGAFEEVKANPAKNNNHVGGIIYTPNPIAVTVMTVNVENYNKRIGEVATMLANYALTLDTKYDEFNAAKAAAAQEEAARLAQEEADRLAREAAEKTAAEKAATESVSVFMNPTPVPTVAPVITAEQNSSLFDLSQIMQINDTQKIIIIAGVAVFILGLVLLIIALNIRRKRRLAADLDDYDDYDDYDNYQNENYQEYASYEDDEEYLEPPAVSSRAKRSNRSEIDISQENESEYYEAEDGYEYYSEQSEDNSYYEENDELPDADAQEEYLIDDEFDAYSISDSSEFTSLKMNSILMNIIYILLKIVICLILMGKITIEIKKIIIHQGID